MSETDELYSTVNYIKNKVDTLLKIDILRMQADSGLKQRYEDILKKDPTLLAIYKVIDGVKIQKEIAQIVGTTEMTVSRKIKALQEEGLIELASSNGLNKNVYVHTVVERAYHFVRYL